MISLVPPFGHGGSAKNLLGDAPSADLVQSLCNETQVTKQTPPTFLVQAIDDPVAVADHPLLMFSALRKARVPAELHLFERGGHGFGLGKPGTPAAAWPGLFLAWIRLHGFLRS